VTASEALVIEPSMIRTSIAIAACALAMVACGGGGATSSTTPDPRSPTAAMPAGDAARGATLYAELGCKGCHGSKEEPGGPGPNLFAITWDDHERAEAREMILKGNPDHQPPMPAYEGKVDDQKIADLVAFVSQK
jgi:mono/diheme cytochrome c family protein